MSDVIIQCCWAIILFMCLSPKYLGSTGPRLQVKASFPLITRQRKDTTDLTIKNLVHYIIPVEPGLACNSRCQEGEARGSQAQGLPENSRVGSRPAWVNLAGLCFRTESKNRAGDGHSPVFLRPSVQFSGL